MVGGIFFVVLGLLVPGLILYASVEMLLKLRRWGLAVAGSVLAMIPCIYPF
jgi:hypothetical protein